jgi:hypothetical protein
MAKQTNKQTSSEVTCILCIQLQAVRAPEEKRLDLDVGAAGEREIEAHHVPQQPLGGEEGN